MSRVLEDALAAAWTLRRKPLESFLLPQAAIGGGLLACADGSLVSLFRIDGARSMTGAGELERFVEVWPAGASTAASPSPATRCT